MYLKKLKNSIFTCVIALFALFLFNTGIVKAASLPAKYNMNLDFNSNTKMLTGSEEVNIKNSSETSLKNLVFHLYPDSYNKKETMSSMVGTSDGKALTEEQKGDISIDKVMVNEKEVKFTQDNQVLKINLNEEFKNDENIKVFIQFKLKLPMGTSRLGYTDDVYSFTDWYPILSMYDSKENKWDETPFNPVGESNYSDVADYNINIKVPKNFVLAATGKEKEQPAEKDSKVMNLSATNVRDFVIITSPNYKVLSKEVDGIKVNSYYIAKDNDDSTKAIAQQTLDSAVGAVKFFSQQFGKYPYDELDLMETYLSGGAMEYPQIIQMPKYHKTIPASENESRNGVTMDQNSFIPEAAVHEVGHQWWYVTVGNNEFKEPFLDESLTAFSTAYYFEKTEGEYSQNSILGSLVSQYCNPSLEKSIANLKFPSINSSVDKFSSNVSGYGLIIYGKGPLLVENLRKKVGDSVFLDIMQTYFKEYKFKNSSIEGFLNIIQKKAGKNVSDAIKSSLSSADYIADDLKLTDDQMKKIDDERDKNTLSTLEKNNGLILGSLKLRVLNSEKAIIVKPSNLKEEENTALDNIIKSTLPPNNNISVKEDKDLTDNDIKNNNIVLLGNPWNNKIFDSIKSNIPIQITKNTVSCDSFSFKNENINGAFTIKNPKNDSKLMLVYFWTKENSFYKNLNLVSGYQFTISVDNKQFFDGKF